MASHLSGYNPRKDKKTTREKEDIEEEGKGMSSERQEQEASHHDESSRKQRILLLTGEGSGQEMKQRGYLGDCKEFGIVQNDKSNKVPSQVHPF